jgi:hypothetical protein
MELPPRGGGVYELVVPVSRFLASGNTTSMINQRKKER